MKKQSRNLFASVIRSIDGGIKIAAENDKYEHINDPDHKHKPVGGGWEKTEKGWSRGKKKDDIKDNSTLDETKKPTQEQSFDDKKTFASEKELSIEIGGQKKKIKYSELKTKDEQITFLEQVKFGDLYSDADLDYKTVKLSTFKSNMDKILSRHGSDLKITKVGSNKKFSDIRKDSASTSEIEKNCRKSMTNVFLKYSGSVLEGDSRGTVFDFIDRIGASVIDAVKSGEMDDVNDTELYAFLQEDVKRLIYQEDETRRRSLGDHGIRHIAGNALHADDMLSKLQQGGYKITAKQRLMAMSTMINHDIGYCVGEPATDGMKGKLHKQYSGDLVREEKERYLSVFGKDAEKMTGDGKDVPGIVQNHDKSNYDWDNDPVGSAVAFADVTSLFGKDKVPELFYKKDDAMEAISKFQVAMTSADFSDEDRKKCFDGFKKKIYGGIAELDTSLENKLMLSDQLKEVDNSFTIRDVLSRSSGKLDGYEFNKETKTMIANTEYSVDGELLDLYFGNQIANYQWDKFTGDISGSGYMAEISGTDSTITYGEKNGSRVALVNKRYMEAPVMNAGVQKTFKEFASYPTKQLMAKLSKKIVARDGASEEDAAKSKKKESERIDSVDKLEKTLNAEIKNDDGKKSKGEMIFGSAWEQVKELFAEMRDGKDIGDKLKKLVGSNEGEKEKLLSYFGIKTSSVWIRNASIKIVADEYFAFINNLSMKIARDYE